MVFHKPIPKIGDVRVRLHFCLFPTRVGEDIVWLERIWVYEEYTRETFYKGNAQYTIECWETVEKDLYIHRG